MSTLYISDLDGTLLNENARLSEFTTSTLNALISDGLLFSVASARSIISAGGILDNAGLKLPGIFMNGALLCEPDSGLTIDYATINSDVSQKMVDDFNMFDRPPTVFTFNGDYIHDKYLSKICVRSGGLKHKADKDFYENRKNKYSSYEITDNFSFNNVIYMNGMDDYNTMKKICDRISQYNEIRCELYLDVYTQLWLLECHSAAATKANRALELKQKIGADKLVVFGDNYNDIEMMDCADQAIAVSNAADEVKEHADIIIDSNINDGVAKYLLSIF